MTLLIDGKPSRSGDTVKNTNHDRANQMGRQAAFANAVSGLDVMALSIATKTNLYAEHKAAGKPLPTTEELSRARQAAVNQAAQKIVARNNRG